MDFKKEADFTFSWKIENFSMLPQKKGERLSSPSFDVEGLYNTAWCVDFYPKGKAEEDHFAIFLRRSKKDGGPHGISIEFKMSILPADGTPDLIFARRFTNEFTPGEGWGFNRFIQCSQALKKPDHYFPNDTLSLQCEMWKDNPEKKTLRECMARTRMSVERITHLWPIKQFSSIKSGLQNGVSVEIYKKFSMKLHWRTDTAEGEGGASTANVYLHIVRTKQEKPTLLDAHIAVLDWEGKPGIVVKGRKLFESETEDEKHEFLISKRKALTEGNATYSPKDVLTLKCELMVSDGVERSAIEECKYMSPPFQNSNKDMSTLVDDLRAAYKMKVFADVKLRAEKKMFPVHRVVLCARSEVFNQMLKKLKTDKPELVELESDESSNKEEEVVLNKDISDKADVNHKADDSATKASKKDREENSTNEDQESDPTKSKDRDNENISDEPENREMDTIAGNQNTQNDANIDDSGNGSQDIQIVSTIVGNGSKQDSSSGNSNQDKESDQDVNELDEDEEENLESTIEDDQNKAKDSAVNDDIITLDSSNAGDKLIQTDANTLEGVTKSKKDEDVDVLDVDDKADTLEHLLDFLYTDELGDLKISSAKDLYCAAVKYKIFPLVTKCLDFLRSSITVENVCEFLEFADLHNVEKLKNFVQGFITTHMADILLSKQWQNFAIRKRNLVEETCRDLRNKRRKLDA